MNRADIDFVLEAIEKVFPLLENIGLVDRLASDAAEQERQKLTRDIHDRVIQPYVGLQLGLAALREKLANTNNGALEDLDKLCELATDEMNELRSYVMGLKSGAGRVGVLLPAVRRFASKYSAATGIPVQVKGTEDLRLNDRLAAEAFQMVVEGLSNVRRHTNARQAEIDVSCDKSDLILRIMNDNADHAAEASFQPASITERAVALGGVVRVYADNDRTVVDVRIPL
jgi:signal transduction histidine kinase